MLERLRDKHEGATIAVVGSGPTAVMFQEDCDVSIGVNGAAKLGCCFNYFMCSDSKSHLRDWFDVRCSEIRIVSRRVATMDRQLYPDEYFPDLERFATPVQWELRVQEIPKPVEPHLVYNSIEYRPGRIHKKQRMLIRGGTISSHAVNLAYLMGAARIQLYGCSFSHETGDYFYTSTHIGRVHNRHRKVMQMLINEVRQKGVAVEVIGPSILK